MTFDSPYGKDYLREFSTQRLGTYSGNCNGVPPSYSLHYSLNPPNLGSNRCYLPTPVPIKYVLFSDRLDQEGYYLFHSACYKSSQGTLILEVLLRGKKLKIFDDYSFYF